jgi:hypothetical protein
VLPYLTYWLHYPGKTRCTNLRDAVPSYDCHCICSSIYLSICTVFLLQSQITEICVSIECITLSTFYSGILNVCSNKMNLFFFPCKFKSVFSFIVLQVPRCLPQQTEVFTRWLKNVSVLIVRCLNNIPLILNA